MFSLSNLREVFFWASGLGGFLFFVHIVKQFLALFRKDGM